MKCNTKEIVHISYGDATIEGRLSYKKNCGNLVQSNFKEKWFKLRLNLLFYFNLSETGTVIDSKPSGAFVLENCCANSVQLSETPFSFYLKFEEENEKHLLSCRSDELVQQWVSAINSASYQFLRGHLLRLQKQLFEATGEEPYPPYSIREFISEEPNEPSHSTDHKHVKIKKNQSFRSYLKRVECSDNSGMHFYDDHFGQESKTQVNETLVESLNTLDLIGNVQTTHSFKISAFHNKSETGDQIDNEPSTSSQTCALSGPKQLRRAPDPPLRPPRGNKLPVQTNNQHITCDESITENLIDL